MATSYGSEITRGLNVLELKPSGLLSQNEIDAAKSVHLDTFNPQSQKKIVWPATFALARAYLDQLGRNDGLSADKRAEAARSLTAAEKQSADARRTSLTTLATKLDGDAATAGDAARVRLLANAVRRLAASYATSRPPRACELTARGGTGPRAARGPDCPIELFPGQRP